MSRLGHKPKCYPITLAGQGINLPKHHLSGAMETAVVKEGRTSFSVPVQDPNASFPPGSASIFFNRRMEINRDTTILLLSVLKPRDYLDAMGATGVRGLRVANECGIPVTINDRDPDAVAEIKRNAEPMGILSRSRMQTAMSS